MRSETATHVIWSALGADVRARFAAARALVLDVDGVMTDGRIHMSTDGSELMTFDVRDGSGTWMLHRAGIRVGIVTGRSTGIPEMRAGALRIDELVSGCREKAQGLARVLSAWGIAPEHCAYGGDDLLDGPAMRLAGLAVAVRDAQPEVQEIAHYVTRRPGGRGAVREVADLLLEAHGVRAEVLRHFVGPRPEDGA